MCGSGGIRLVANSDEQTKSSVAVAKNTLKHVAIIMDGNGRWAKNRLLPREAGHVKGIAALRQTLAAARELGISYLTVYAFSTENWERPQSEVLSLMGLFRRFFHADMKRLQKENVRVRFIGQREGLDSDIAALVDEAEQMTEVNAGLNFTVAFNYGAREEMVIAAQSLARDAATGRQLRIPRDTGIAGAVFGSGELLNIPDAYEDQRFDHQADKDTGYRTRSILAMPLRDRRGKVFGVAQILNRNDGKPFDSSDEQRFAKFLQSVGVLLETWRTMRQGHGGSG